ncbi:sugar kinase [Spiractinospora alimapuensis]|uniref:xylulokinase n=1 Tax=Spiractinospora alimapuensis TaxID=2820884 RepID=UPI001EFF4F9F|nr:FGGY family carbohydrate kinase [Spiractinospora alimapuensis]QVQ54434.1 sugar kinase [Spiractinospora alimapuensis]
MAEAVIGIDLGTSGVKAVVAEVDGGILAESEASYPVRSPHPGWAETDPEAWWTATVTAVRDAVVQARASQDVQPVAVGLAGQMHGLVLARRDTTAARPAMLWPDSRAADVLSGWESLPDEERARLANPILPGMTGPLYRWAALREPSTVDSSDVGPSWVLLPKDWLRFRLTGCAATEPTDASATLLWDVPGDAWSSAAVEAAGLDPAGLPPVVPSGASGGPLTRDAAATLRLPVGIPVAAGAGDTPAALAAALASTADPGATLVTVGSGAQVLALTDEPVAAAGTHVYRTVEATGWYRMAAVANAGLALGWVRDTLNASWSDLMDACAVGHPGANGVLFAPFLTPERFGTGSAGGFAGLRLDVGREDLLRAAVEGVAFTIRYATELMPEPLSGTIHLAGGIGRTPAFGQLLADVLGVPLSPLPHRSLSALGACQLAARTTGVNLPTPPAREIPTITPSDNAKLYRTTYETWREGRVT